MSKTKDADFDWLDAHLPEKQALSERHHLASKVAGQLAERVAKGKLPFTIGVTVIP